MADIISRGFTVTTITATGTSALIAAAGTNTSIIVYGAEMFVNTNTNAQTFGIREGAGSNVFTRRSGSTGAAFSFSVPNPEGWLLETNTALNFNVAAAATAPSIDVAVSFQILRRGAS